MTNSNQFDWVDFYKELAIKLRFYKADRQVLIDKVKNVFEGTELNLPTLESYNNIVDIDPFTVYGLFNRGFKIANRIAIVTSLAREFGITAAIPTSFDSIPVLNNQNAIFYRFLPDRDVHDIDNLWELFDTAIEYAKAPSPYTRERFSKYYDICVNTKGNGTSKITMGLYWIAPDVFVNLDSRNRWYIYTSGQVPPEFVITLPELQERVTATKYFEILDKLSEYLKSGKSKLHNFVELSFEAWNYSELDNKRQKEAAQKTEDTRETQVSGIADEGVSKVRYWIYAPGHHSSKWEEFYSKGIMAIGWDEIGDLSQYSNKNEMKEAMKKLIDSTKSFTNDAHATWQFANEMMPGDIVFAKKGMSSIVGRGVVESEYYYDAERDEYKNVRKVRWTHKGEWPHPGKAVLKTLTDISAYTNYKKKLDELFEDEMDDDEEDIPEMAYPIYDSQMFLKDVYMSESKYQKLTSLVLKKKNVILQGAPGVGKTYAAKRLAYSIMGVKDPSRVMMIQFHQSYSYEDFIMGYRPTPTGGFEPKSGAFYEFCKKAAVDSEETPYFFIIDEINRGNLSKIFGELFMLIETDKRGYEMRLLYSDELFSVPKNVYIIGMMNTADRSLAMLDYALRRRFAFFDMAPGFDTDGFVEYRESLKSERFDKLISCVKRLNNKISEDDSLGEGFCIGHSYFCGLRNAVETELSQIVEYELAPLLKEYWFDEQSKARNWIDELRSAIK